MNLENLNNLIARMLYASFLFGASCVVFMFFFLEEDNVKIFEVGRNVFLMGFIQFFLIVCLIKILSNSVVNKYVPEKWSDLSNDEWIAIPLLPKIVFWLQNLSLLLCSFCFGWFFLFLIIRN